jgi:hypothetical protein
VRRSVSGAGELILRLKQTVNTKNGLSSGAVTVCCSLCDELPDFGRSENDRQPFEQKTLTIVLMEKSVQSWHHRSTLSARFTARCAIVKLIRLLTSGSWPI